MRNLISASLLSMNLVCGAALAQVVPIGMSQGGLTGGSASPMAGGGEIPLSFPPERDGLPIPLAFVHGGSKVMEAGLGWGIPIWSITASQNASRHRPRYDIDASNTLGPSNIEPRVTLSMGGGTIPIIKIDDSGHWRAIVDHQTYQITEYLNGVYWEMTDGAGRRYRFEHPAGTDAGWPWLLTHIYGSKRAQARVDVNYLIDNIPFSGVSVPELRLDSIEYNFHKSGACGKHKIQLTPTPSGGPVLSTTVDGGHFRVRTRLVNSISLQAQGASCGTPKTLRNWELIYANDPDTTLPRLARVDMEGRDGTPEQFISVPVARYGYGQVLQSSATAGQSLTYGAPSTVTLPADFSTNSIGRLTSSGFNVTTAELFADWNGDGMADFARVTGVNSPLAIALNQGGTTFVDSPPPGLSPSQVSQAESPQNNNEDMAGTSIERVYSQVIDMNGDGRPDFVDALAAPHSWLIYLNQPSAADPTVPSWQTVLVDVSNVMQDLNTHLYANGEEYLPLQRSQTGAHVIQGFNYFYGQYIPDGNPPDVRGRSTSVEWKLADVNGDGYPDLVSNSAPLHTQLINDGCRNQVPGCTRETEMNFVATNNLRAYLNRAGAYLSGSSTPFAAPIPINGSMSDSSVEVWVQGWTGSSGQFNANGKIEIVPGGPGPRQMVAGFMDVNGDGILDRIDGSLSLLGSGWVDSSGYPSPVPAPEQGASFGYYIPGPHVPGPMLTTVSGRYQTCGMSSTSSTFHLQYPVWTSQALLDVTGDGIPDYVDTSKGTVRVGTGMDFAPEVPIQVPGRTLAISTVLAWCDDSGDPVTKEGLFDINGDGRLDLVQAGNADGTPSTQLTVWQLSGATGGTGALDAGQIISESNGYGATHNFTWGSAKSDTSTHHQVPFPEIVLKQDSFSMNESLGPAPAPTYYAYGDIRLMFDGATDHWTTRGYDRKIAVTGIFDGRSSVIGSAVISDQMRPQDLNNEYDRYVLLGRPREETTLSGSFPSDPMLLLQVNTANDFRFSAQTDSSWSTSSAAIAGKPSFVTDCTGFVNPFVDITAKVSRADAVCYTTGIGALRSSYGSTGTAAPPSDQNLQSATVVSDVDSLGRPHLILHRGDTHRLDDDFCEERLYAAPTSTWQIQTAPKSVRYFVGNVPPAPGGGIAPPTSMMDCGTQMRLLSGARFAYDGLAEGSVALGRLTQQIAERYDVGSGALLDSFTQSTLTYDANGAPFKRVDEAGSGHTVTTTFTLDAFGMAPTGITTNGSGVSAVLTRTRTLDEYTLAAKDESDQSGLNHHVERDGFDRPTLTSFKDPADNMNYLESAFAYLGETNVQATDQIDPLGRRTLVRSWRDRVPLANFNSGATAPGANENWQTSYADELGRARSSVANLGPDRPSQIVGGETTRDLLGRVEFVADPYVLSTAAPHYGTTYFYRSDNSLRCAVRGRGDQTTVANGSTTDASVARYASCTDRVYSANQARLRAWEPDQNLSTGPGAYEERVMTGAGWRIEESRHSSSTVLELMQLAYDPLGNNTTITRYSAPATPSGAVTWTMSYDSFGVARAVSEPATATRSFTTDRLGRQLSVSWMDGFTARAVNTEYDAFGRATRNYEGTATAPLNENDLHYDAAGPGGYQLAQPFLTGKLSWAQNGLRTLYFSYDGLGGTAATTELDADGTRVDLGYQNRLDGAPSAISYKLPDDNFALEQATYGYDSAGTLKTVGWQDGSSSSPLFDASESDIDAFGRYQQVRFGNGTQRLNTYNPGDRRELTAWQLKSPNGTTLLSSSFPNYDGEGRILQRVDVSAARNDYSWFSYDAADRLATATIAHTNGAVVNNPVYSYDGLGNITSIYDSAGNQNSTRAFDATDGDRLASITTSTLGFPRFFNTTTFTYDALGNVKTNAGRSFSYDGRGRPQTIAVASNVAQWAYGPLGGVATLSIVGSANGDSRIDQHFGLVRATTAGGVTRVFERNIPGAGVKRRGFGVNAAVDYSVGEAKGTRGVTNKSGAIVQEIDYQPFGRPRIDTDAPNQSDYQNDQFNGGDYLADFGINQIGARLYDPVSARFLMRDPLMIPRSAGRAHPYGFAWNDPINHGDPSGMDTAAIYGSGSDAGSAAAAAGVAIGIEMLNDLFDHHENHGGRQYPDSPRDIQKPFDLPGAVSIIQNPLPGDFVLDERDAEGNETNDMPNCDAGGRCFHRTKVGDQTIEWSEGPEVINIVGHPHYLPPSLGFPWKPMVMMGVGIALPEILGPGELGAEAVGTEGVAAGSRNLVLLTDIDEETLNVLENIPPKDGRAWLFIHGHEDGTFALRELDGYAGWTAQEVKAAGGVFSGEELGVIAQDTIGLNGVTLGACRGAWGADAMMSTFGQPMFVTAQNLWINSLGETFADEAGTIPTAWYDMHP